MGNKKTDEKVKRGISTPQGLKMSSGALLALTFILPPERKNKQWIDVKGIVVWAAGKLLWMIRRGDVQ